MTGSQGVGPLPDDHATDPDVGLVVSYCFPPFADAAGVVAAKRVREAGLPVDVVQNRMDAIRPRDPMLGAIAGPYVRRQVLVPSVSAFASWGSVRDFTEEGLQHALAWDRDRGYRRLYSRAQFAASHVLAARFALLRPNAHWTAEFSDPLSHDVTGAVRFSPVADDALLAVLADGLRRRGVQPPTSGNVYEWSEVLAFAVADTVLFTNEHQRTFMLRELADEDLAARVRERSVISPHPTPPPELYSAASPAPDLDPGRRHVAYFGSFYATRGIGTVLDALAALPAPTRERLLLHVHTSDSDDLLAAVRRLDLGGSVQVSPLVGYLDFLALSRRFDCLLVNDAVTPVALGLNPYLPSKWSDYRGSGTPVWGLVEPGSTLDAQDLHHRSPVGHTSAAVQVLAQLADAPPRHAGGSTTSLSRTATSS